MARRGRGRLSAIDRLPEWADECKMWAFEQLKERKLAQLEILEAFNDRLRAAAWEQGIAEPPQISRSAFNRSAVRLAVLGRRLQETREIAAVLAPKIEAAGDNELTLMVSETIKTLVAEMLGNAGELSPDGNTAQMLMFTSRALKHAEEAKKISTDTRRQIEAQVRSSAGKAIDAAVEKGAIDAAAAAKAREIMGFA